MAKSKSIDSSKRHITKAKRKRPGVHAKCRTSVSKNSKYYKKTYKSQGR